jgi:hypothetical protein
VNAGDLFDGIDRDSVILDWIGFRKLRIPHDKGNGLVMAGVAIENYLEKSSWNAHPVSADSVYARI